MKKEFLSWEKIFIQVGGYFFSTEKFFCKRLRVYTIVL